MDAETLRDLYETQRLTTRQIGERAGVSYMTVQRWLRKHGIAARHAGRGLANRGLPQPTADELRRLVHEEHIPYAEIARRYGATERAVHYWLDSFGIPRSDIWITRRRGYVPPLPSADELRRLYLDEGVSLEEIGLMYGVSEPPIRRLTKKLGIEVKPSGFDGGKRYVCDDGHVVRSIYEKRVDDWLTELGIAHEYEPCLPLDCRYRADFLANGWYIEIWGVIGSDQYAVRHAYKLEIYQRHDAPLIELIPHDFGGQANGRWLRKLAPVITQSH